MKRADMSLKTKRLRDAFIDAINEIYPDDLNDGELAALTSIIRGAIERRDRPAPVLQLVHPQPVPTG